MMLRLRHRLLVAAVLGVALGWSGIPAHAAPREVETFHGWSLDSTWYAYERVEEAKDLAEIFFCATPGSTPTWPKEISDFPEAEEGRNCFRLSNATRAPRGWKSMLSVPKPSMTSKNGTVHPEPVFDTERAGLAIDQGKKRIVCPVPGVREDSKIGPVFWSPKFTYVAAMVDGKFVHCPEPLGPVPAAAATHTRPGKK